MDSSQAANAAPPPSRQDAAQPPPAPRARSQPPSLPITLLVLALLIVIAGGPLRRRFGATLYPIAYVAAAFAVLTLPLVFVGGWRQRALGTSRLLLGRSIEQWSCFAVFVLFLAFYGVTRAGPTPFYEPSVQAVAFLHGHSWVDAPGHVEQVSAACNISLPAARALPECDFTRFQGRTFLVHPPLAAIVMMPFVAAHGSVIDGADEYQPTVAALLGAIEVALAWRLLLLLGLSTSACIWLTAFFGIGTTLWYEATLGASWDFVLVVSVLPTLLALNELFGKARPWVVGVFAALAALGRNDLVMAWPIYGLILLVRGRRIRDLFAMAPGFAMAAAVYGTFNYTRYGTFFDQSLWLWYRCCDGGGYNSTKTIPGPFSVHFLPPNLYTLLFLGWGFNSTAFPWVRAQGAGQALLFTSPAFVLALRPSLKRAMTLLMWLASVLTMSASLTVYASGFVQFGTRYYVQIFPFLLVLVALGVGPGKPPDQLTKILIVASIFLVCFGLAQIRTIGFG
jgi:hypothetical protein